MIISLRFKKYSRIAEGIYSSTETAERLFSAASNLPTGQNLEWNVSLHRDGRCTSSVTSSDQADVSKEDISWIFEECASIDEGPEDSLKGTDGLCSESQNVYVLKPVDSKANEVVPGGKELNQFVRQTQGRELKLRFIAGPEEGGSEGYGMAMILSNEELPLRIRSVITRIFPGTMLRRIEGTSDVFQEAHLPGRFAQHCLKTILQILIYEMKEVEETRYINTDPDYVPIEEFGISNRSIRVLKADGVNSIEKLLEMDDSEIKQIQGLEEDELLELRIKIGELKLMEEVISEVMAECEEEVEEEENKKDYWDMLDDMVGLEEVKFQVRKLAALARMKKELPDGKFTNISLHTAFLGNPGTAKTTVARILAGLLYDIGLLESDNIVEVSRADLVAGYVGQTAERTKEVFEKARGKLLFVDEAYSLQDRDNGSFGQEAIDEFVLQMENQREETVVIFAGYPNQMKAFIKTNPGLRSRVPFQITFNDYNTDELIQITQKEAGKRGFAIRSEAMEKVRTFCEAAEGNSEAGNGRFCRNLVEHAVLNYAQRVFGKDEVPDEVELSLAPEDFTEPEVLRKGEKDKKIGFQLHTD